MIHEKTNLECDCRSLDCSGGHPQCNERRYCPTVICPTATVSSWGLPYHAAPDVGVAALRQNQGGAAPQQATHNGRVEARRESRFRDRRQYGLLSPRDNESSRRI